MKKVKEYKVNYCHLGGMQTQLVIDEEMLLLNANVPGAEEAGKMDQEEPLESAGSRD